MIFYVPKDGVCGDFIPFYNHDRKVFELYYLHDYRGIAGHGEGTDWRRISTTDMAAFCEEGEIISRGSAEGRDLFCYTGCVVAHQGVQHIFYTGHNYHLMETGGRKESVMHAVSQDGTNFQKQTDLTFYAPEGLDIEQNDWRDPFVFYDEAEKIWKMLLCTRKKHGPDRLRGATGLLKSEDLNHWTYCGSFWSPSNCWCPECPDLFSWGDWWYLVYSTFSEAEGFRTYYRMAKSPNGPWKAPAYNTFDGRAFYAGKTASDGVHRYIFGWNPTREGNKDFGVWQWGGCLVIHELVQTENGELRVKLPAAIKDTFVPGRNIAFTPFLGEMREKGKDMILSAESGFAAAMGGEIPHVCMVTAQIKLAEGTQDAGLWFHSDKEGDEGYYLRLEAGHSRLVFDRVHRACDYNDIARHAQMSTETWHDLTVLLDGTAMTAYLDDKVALSARMYDYTGKHMLAFVSDGEATFRNLKVSTQIAGEE